MLKAFAASCKKEDRILNGDSLGLYRDNFFVVADGVSKSPYPDLASAETVSQFGDFFLHRTTEPTDEELHEFLLGVNAEVKARSFGSLSTVCSAWLLPAERGIYSFYGVSVGDSRLYLLDPRGEPSLRVLSHDHTFRKFDVWRLKYKVRLYASCGGQMVPDIRLAITRGYLDHGEWLILATDGVWAYIEKERESFLKMIPVLREDTQETIDWLVRAAASRTHDDATIIIVMNE